MCSKFPGTTQAVAVPIKDNVVCIVNMGQTTGFKFGLAVKISENTRERNFFDEFQRLLAPIHALANAFLMVVSADRERVKYCMCMVE